MKFIKQTRILYEFFFSEKSEIAWKVYHLKTQIVKCLDYKKSRLRFRYMMVSWNNHKEIIAWWCTKLLIDLRIYVANIFHVYIGDTPWQESIRLVCHILQSGILQKSKLSCQKQCFYIFGWACDPSLSAELVILKVCWKLLLVKGITVMKQFQGFCTTLLLIGDMPDMSWFFIDYSIRLIGIFILILFEAA